MLSRNLSCRPAADGNRIEPQTKLENHIRGRSSPIDAFVGEGSQVDFIILIRSTVIALHQEALLLSGEMAYCNGAAVGWYFDAVYDCLS